MTFRVFGEQHHKKPEHILADLEAKYGDKKNGLTITQTWTTHNALKTVVELEDKVAKGVKLELATSLTPGQHGSDKAVAAKSSVLTAIWKQPGLHSRASLDLFKVRSSSALLRDGVLKLSLACTSLFFPAVGVGGRASCRVSQGPTVTADAVLGRDGFLIGLEAAYDVNKGALTRYATALGFSAPEYAVALHGLHNLSTYSASYYHRVNPDVEAGAKATWDTKAAASAVSLEVAAKAYVFFSR